MSGLAGRIFGPLGIAYIWAILASLVIAVTVTPALCIALLSERDLPAQEPPAVHWLKKGYHGLLVRIEKVPRLATLGPALLVAIGIGTLFFFERVVPAREERKIFGL